MAQNLPLTPANAGAQIVRLGLSENQNRRLTAQALSHVIWAPAFAGVSGDL
jgi:hypothetical protein